MSNQIASIASQAAGILKNWYAGPLVTQFNDDMPLYREIEKGKEKFQGNQVVRSLKVLRNQGTGAGSDGGNMPSIGTQGNTQAIIAAKFNWLRAGITAGLMKSAQSDKGAFINAVSNEMDGGMDDLKASIARQLFYDGSGKLATVAAAATASTIITVTGRDSSENGNKYFQGANGMVIDIVDVNGVYKAQGVTVTAVSGTVTATLTLNSAVTVAATDLVVMANSYNAEVQGLLVSQDGATSTIYSVNRSTYPVYQGNLVSASGGQLTLDLMQQTLNAARERGGGKIDAIFCDFTSERYYNKLLVADKRFVGKVVGDGSFTSKSESYLEFGGVKVAPDKDCFSTFHFLDSSNYKKYVLAELEWASESGSEFIPQSDVDAFELRLRLFFNLFPEKPSASARLGSYISP